MSAVERLTAMYEAALRVDRCAGRYWFEAHGVDVSESSDPAATALAALRVALSALDERTVFVVLGDGGESWGWMIMGVYATRELAEAHAGSWAEIEECQVQAVHE